MDMINLAIVVSVSDYGEDLQNLPACQRDGAAIREVLHASGRFHEILHLYGSTTSSNVKQKISEFIKKYSSNTVGELLFYFTGHGDYLDNEFYYLLSDYSSRRRKQTSLENSELDNIARALSPSLFVKIVDACRSGVAYIKGADELQEYLNKGKSTFSSLYFLYSSQSEQSSYQDAQLRV